MEVQHQPDEDDDDDDNLSDDGIELDDDADCEEDM